jgi:hypothetical protein
MEFIGEIVVMDDYILTLNLFKQIISSIGSQIQYINYYQSENYL